MEQLHGLIGCWKAVGFVDPTDYRVSLQSRSSSAADVMKRNELVRLMATTDEQVLYGVYVNDPKLGFWIVALKKPASVVLKAQGEMKYGGSYKLSQQSSDSLRHAAVESHHVIRWKRHSGNIQPAVARMEAPLVPKSVIQRKHKRPKQCVCGDSHSGFPDGGAGSERGLFVCIHKPNARKQDLESSVKKDRIRGIWEFARLKAHWKPAQKLMAIAKNAKVIILPQGNGDCTGRGFKCNIAALPCCGPAWG